ncbi:hypothetical protein AAFF_G00326160 [Aldrovandia affinis]|uniref:ribonuclease H n=1 Tax=Aldrovandia affinis TaxID=143900 RepID=A0AAD7T9Q5_9TELE|nr:hypothetical protein AAFF_G00326160 [Aldrovandia affinis]
MEHLGIIRRSNSPWASPLHMVPKPDGGCWPCRDYRRLNDDRPVSSPARAGFFGLTGWESHLLKVLRDLTFLYVYLDVILIATECKAEHLSHLGTLFEQLSRHGLIVNPAKCQFGLPSIDFLGHHITWDGATPQPAKMAAISDFTQPHTTKALQEFLGMPLSYISEFTTYVQHVAGKNNVVADCLSKAVVDAVHLGIDYACMATDQASDPDVQAYRMATTSLQLTDVSYEGAGDLLLCDISTGQPCPVIPESWRRQVFNAIHVISHPSRKPSQRLVAARFVWHGLQKDV